MVNPRQKVLDYRVVCERTDLPAGQEDQQTFVMTDLPTLGAHLCIVERARELFPKHAVVSYGRP